MRRPKFELEIKAARKKLAELEKLENSKKVIHQIGCTPVKRSARRKYRDIWSSFSSGSPS